MSKNPDIIAGIDEVGRGCIAGPVIASAVVLDPKNPILGLIDSKKLTTIKRQNFADLIKAKAIDWALGRAEASEIDKLNILQATLLAMCRAYSQLKVTTNRVLVDGIFYPDIPCPGEAIVRGDCLVAEISAASILAKVARDEEMKTLDILYSGYGFAKHKGYSTKLHLQNLQRLGIIEQHRKSFAPIRSLCS